MKIKIFLLIILFSCCGYATYQETVTYHEKFSNEKMDISCDCYPVDPYTGDGLVCLCHGDFKVRDISGNISGNIPYNIFGNIEQEIEI
jgi:hypothetical protein